MKIQFEPSQIFDGNFRKGRLYVNEQNNSIVLCTETSTQLIGVRIAGACVGIVPNGEFATHSLRWASENFTPYKGTVTLTEG